MADNVTLSTSYMAYIGNTPYSYPGNDKSSTDNINLSYNTGWHIIPSILFKHFCTPRAWAEFNINYEAYHVEGYKITLFNMIPMTTQLAIQGTNVFTAFNNTIYALGFQDDVYETPYHNWLQSNDDETHANNLLYKEGLIAKYESSNKIRYTWPIYQWAIPRTRTTTDETWAFTSLSGAGEGVFPSKGKPTGILWDPMNEPSKLMEFRPGKNAISYSWNCHPCDEHVWFNLDQQASWWPWGATGPYNGRKRPGTITLYHQDDPDQLASQWQTTPSTNDYTIPNLGWQPIVPMAW